MIKQTALLFRLNDLQVFSITYVGSKLLKDQASSPTATITEEIWWVDPSNVKGVGPFPSLALAMKDYEAYAALKALPPPPPPPNYDTLIIPVDFKNKARLPFSPLPVNPGEST